MSKDDILKLFGKKIDQFINDNSRKPTIEEVYEIAKEFGFENEEFIIGDTYKKSPKEIEEFFRSKNLI